MMNFATALENLTRAFNHGEFMQTVDIDEYLKVVCDYATDHGLATASIKAILRILLAPKTFNQATLNRLFQVLFPIEAIPGPLIYFIVGRLGLGKQKALYASQQAAIKWLTLVFDMVEATSLSRCYGVLFDLLGVFPLRAHLCHLLAKLSQPKNIWPSRVQYLQHLEDGITSDAAISRLIDAFVALAPEMFPQRKVKSPVVFNHPDRPWIETLNSIKFSSTTSSFPVAISTEDFRLYTGHADLIATSTIRTSTQGHRDINTQSDLISKLNSLDLSIILRTNIITQDWQTLFALRFENSGAGKTEQIFQELCEQQSAAVDDEGRIAADFLDVVLGYCRRSQNLPPAVLDLLWRYLPRWRPAIHFEQEALMLQLLSYIPIMPWDDLDSRFIRPVESAILGTSLDSLITLLNLYTSVFSRWTSRLSLSSSASDQDFETIANFQVHTSLLNKAILTHTDHPSQLSVATIIDHLEAFVPLVSPPILIPLSPPDPLLVSTLLFASPTLSTISRVSSILARYKQAFQHPPRSNTEGVRTSIDINTLNASLLDTCNLLLRSQAFSRTEPHAQGCLVPEPLVSLLSKYTAAASLSKDIGVAFILPCHPALAALSAVAFMELEEEAGKEVRHEGLVSQRSLVSLGRLGGLKLGWKEYRVHILAWLEAMGVGGIGLLGRSTMRGLMGNEKGRDSVDKRGLTT